MQVREEDREVQVREEDREVRVREEDREVRVQEPREVRVRGKVVRPWPE